MLQLIGSGLLQKFGVYASEVKNTEPTSRGFDFYTYANSDPYATEPGNEPDASKFNARAVRSFQYLEDRAERLEKMIKSLSKDVGTKELDINLSPVGPLGPTGAQGTAPPALLAVWGGGLFLMSEVPLCVQHRTMWYVVARGGDRRAQREEARLTGAIPAPKP